MQKVPIDGQAVRDEPLKLPGQTQSATKDIDGEKIRELVKGTGLPVPIISNVQKEDVDGKAIRGETADDDAQDDA